MPSSASPFAQASPMPVHDGRQLAGIEGSAEAPADAAEPSAPQGFMLRCPISSKDFLVWAKPCRGPTSCSQVWRSGRRRDRSVSIFFGASERKLAERDCAELRGLSA
eukprot:5126529-Alexandrium_andersonii.AAC.1